jgi:RNA-directed DNA polymerase
MVRQYYHDALLRKVNTYPKLHKIIKGWLKAGILDEGVFQKSDAGTSQGGIVSPLLANIALNGVEEHVKDRLDEDLFQSTKARIKEEGLIGNRLDRQCLSSAMQMTLWLFTEIRTS